MSFRVSFLSLYNVLVNRDSKDKLESKTFTKKYNSLTIATLIALMISNPFDVVATKITT